MEKDDKQVMVIITNLKNSNKDLWYKIMNMPIEISRLTSELDEALKELRDLKEYIANLNIDDFRKRL
jgi:succinate dehydrogenase/fumarate reductase flavoprotein subunit